MCYDLHNKLLYLDDYEKCGFIKRYIQEVLQKYTIIKGIYSSIEEFEDKINDIIDIKFIQFDNVMNRSKKSIYNRVVNIFGLDVPDKLEITIRAKEGIVKKNFKQLLRMCKLKKNNGEIENIVIIGKDENSMTHVFDFSTILSKIRIDIKKNENKMYDEEEVKKLLLKEIR